MGSLPARVAAYGHATGRPVWEPGGAVHRLAPMHGLRFSAVAWVFGLAALGSQQPADAAKAPNAMELYDLAWQEAVRLLEASERELLQVPFAPDRSLGELGLDPARLPGVVDKAAGARQLFAQATAAARCELADPGGSASSFDDRTVVRVYQLAVLVAAHGWFARVEQPAVAVADAASLLRASRQLSRLEHRDGLAFHGTVEMLGLCLLADALQQLARGPRDAAVVAEARRELAAHRERRITLEEYYAHQLRIAELAMERPPAAREGDDAATIASLAEGREARQLALAIVQRSFAPYARGELPTAEHARAVDAEIEAGWRVRGGAFEDLSRPERVRCMAYGMVEEVQVCLVDRLREQRDQIAIVSALDARFGELTQGR